MYLNGLKKGAGGISMTDRSGNPGKPAISPAQLCLELEMACLAVERLARTIQLVGNVGVTDPETAIELEMHLGSALAAAHRWLLETRLLATGTDVAPVR